MAAAVGKLLSCTPAELAACDGSSLRQLVTLSHTALLHHEQPPLSQARTCTLAQLAGTGNPDRDFAQMEQQAGSLKRQGRHDEALKLLLHIRDSSTIPSAGIISKIGHQYATMGHRDEAEKVLRECRVQYPFHEEGHVFLASLYIKGRKTNEAFSTMESAVLLMPHSKQLRAALQSLQRSNPDDPRWAELRKRMQEEDDEDDEMSEAGPCPGSATPAAATADTPRDVQITQADVEEAARRREAGNACMQQGGEAGWEKAIKEYSEGLKRNPKCHLLWTNRSQAHIRRQMWKEALHDAEEAIKIQGAYWKAHCRKGSALWGLRLEDRAVDAYGECLKIDPENVSTRDLLEKDVVDKITSDKTAGVSRLTVALKAMDTLLARTGAVLNAAETLRLQRKRELVQNKIAVLRRQTQQFKEEGRQKYRRQAEEDSRKRQRTD
eukprot:TRINITY_DN9645_c0_g1_i1.p1 TRINITY_DN9645_c0_g1~~TRINITY_DN9645_c0_g1_i1.p1  ORF type:complete len:474 (+),score=149.89 TRINITY_DN9645_c0_g1_i1:112-1422(+)